MWMARLCPTLPDGQADFRFTPKSGHSLSRPACPLCAKSGHCGGHDAEVADIAKWAFTGLARQQSAA